jgi:hypothetical protein
MIKYQSNSRENQDRFVLAVLDKKINGTYVEIGGFSPITDNNTFLLEKEFNWRGVSVEWDIRYKNEWDIRKNICVFEDATKIDYDQLFKENNLGPHIDYLQLDIDPPHNTFKCLLSLDFNKYSFSVITYEHDFYNGGEKEREESRKILEKNGYTRVISNVMHRNLIFEDWYINESYMSNDNWKLFIGENINMNNEDMDEKYIQLLNNLI